MKSRDERARELAAKREIEWAFLPPTERDKLRTEVEREGYKSREPVRVEVGKPVFIELPHSEVCMHMGIAGEVRQVELHREHPDHPPMARIFRPGTEGNDGPPVTPAEAGIHSDAGAFYAYTLPNEITITIPRREAVAFISDSSALGAYGLQVVHETIEQALREGEPPHATG